MTAQVHQLSQEKLDRLAAKIKGDLERRTQIETDWVEATIELCADLAEARAEFRDDIGFGRWFDASGFDLNKDDRAAVITMGQDLVRAREVLTATKRRSLRLICDNEFRFRSSAKPPKRQPPSAPLQKVLDEIDRRTVTGEDVSYTALKEATGASASVVGKATAIKEAADPTPLPELSLTAQQKLEVWQRKRDAEFEHRVSQEVQRRLVELHLPRLEEKLDKLRLMLSWPQYSVMTKAEYNQIRFCLHEDTRHSRTQEQLNAACHIIDKYKLKLINDAEERENALRQLRSNLPTREEMLARLKAKRS